METINHPACEHPSMLAAVEPHAAMLTAPLEHQILYKVMRVEDLISSVAGSYLYFKRVDKYGDGLGGDKRDGEQLARDRVFNAAVKFERVPEFSDADYNDLSRSRTYASCFSTENSEHIWSEYGNGGSHGKVCLPFNFGRLRAHLNAIMDPSRPALMAGGILCKQIFSINYGLMEYVEWEEYRANSEFLQNPLRYTYFKDKKFSREKEFRISLSALGIGQFALNDGTLIEFPPSLQLGFDFRAAFADGTITQILRATETDMAYLDSELAKLHIRIHDEAPRHSNVS